MRCSKKECCCRLNTFVLRDVYYFFNDVFCVSRMDVFCTPVETCTRCSVFMRTSPMFCAAVFARSTCCTYRRTCTHMCYATAVWFIDKTKFLASARGWSRTMAIRISSHSLGMRAGLPSCICCMIATALFSHSVRSHSSLVLCANIELRGGPCCWAGVHSVQKKGLSGAEGAGRALIHLTTRRISLTLMS